MRRLLQQLSSTRYAEREAATRELTATESARLYLERLQGSEDQEVATRASRILAEHDRVYAKTRLRRYFRYGREGQVERMVEGLARWTGPIDNEEFWQDVRGVAVEVAKRVEKPKWTLGWFFPQDFVQALKRSKGPQPVFRRVTEPWSDPMQHGGFLSTGAPIRTRALNNATTVSAGPVIVDGWTVVGNLLTTDDFESGTDQNDRVAGFVVISAGRVKLHRSLERSLIVARGGIDATNCRYIHDCCLASSGKVLGTEKAETRTCTVQESQGRPLGFIQWFETTTIGFEAGRAKSGFKVTGVTAESVAGSAGLRVGDVITRIDGEPVKATNDEFRKQLRRGSVQDICDLTVLRGNRTETIVLDFRGDNKE